MRGVNRFASGLLGLILIVVGVAAALATALVWAGRPVGPLNRWYQTLSQTTVANRAVLITAIVVGVVGLLVLLSQVRHWAPDRILVGTPPDGEAGTVSPGATATSLGMVPDEPVMVLRGAAPGEVEATPWWVTRRSVQRRTATAAGSVGGVSGSHATVRGRPGQWRLRVRADGPADRRDAVQRAIRAELDRLDAPADTAIELALRTPRGRVR